MNFVSNVVRAAIPVALVAMAPAALAAPSSDLKAVETSLAATRSMTADFVQTNPRGDKQSGTLSLKRPGKIRFAYQGVNALMVADGKTLHYLDYDVAQHSKWALEKLPLGRLLAPSPDLGRVARIVPSNNNPVVVVRARDARRPEFGTLVLAFVRRPGAPGGLQLEGWTAIDAQNKKTTVRLANQRYNVAVPDSAFDFTVPKRKKT